MKARLFTKILLGFWLTLFVMGYGLWLLFSVQGSNRPTPATAMDQVASVSALLGRRIETDGLKAAEADLASLPALIQAKMRISQVETSHASTIGNHSLSRAYRAPDGRSYSIDRRPAAVMGVAQHSAAFQIAMASGIAGLLFSLALARYIIMPLHTLRSAFAKLADGQLDVRVGSGIGRRRDEVADLARDFDIMADRLDQLVGARDRLLHDISHELRSPLSRLQVAVGLARQDPKRHVVSLDRIEREAQRLDGMVGELLALARAEGGFADEAYFDPMAVVEAAADDVRFLAQADGVGILCHALAMDEDARPVARGNAELFRRAIENVLRNAVRFSPRGTEVKVLADFDRQGSYLFSIVDDGPGSGALPPSTLFDPFVRADSAGLGLGLSIARRAITANGGRIDAHNRPEGGFQVDVILPVHSHLHSKAGL